VRKNKGTFSPKEPNMAYGCECKTKKATPKKKVVKKAVSKAGKNSKKKAK
jgi:hypothetical protein